jgi:hypothetical protein
MSYYTNTSTNVEDYTIEDLFAILNIHNEAPTEFQVKDEADKIIVKLKLERKPDLAVFIADARDKVIEFLVNEEEGNVDEYDGQENTEQENDYAEEDKGNIQYDENTQQGNWWQNQYPAQSDEVERTKPTDRKQKVEIFDKEGKQNNAFVMNRERLGVLQSHPIPVVQGTINPNLKNIIRRIVSIDSQYRSNIVPYSDNNINAPTFNTDFTFDLSERLTNVLSMKLNSIQIPTSWYIFDDSLGNTCFKYINSDPGNLQDIFVKIPSGNYSLPFLNAFFKTYTYIPTPGDPTIVVNLHLYITVDEVTGKIIFCSDYSTITLIFYDSRQKTIFNSCLDNSCGTSQMKLNQNFGWNLGYRTNDENLLSIEIIYNNTSPPPPPSNQLPAPNPAYIPTGYKYYNIAQAPANLYGPTYFLLVIDDYNNNRVNNSLVTITNVSNKLDLPSYYSPAYKNANNTFATIGCPNVLNAADPALNVPESTLPYMTRSSPRQLTQSQLYTANEILYNRTTYSNKTFGPSTADVLALIPLSGIGNLRTKIAYVNPTPGTFDPNANLVPSIANSQISQPFVTLSTGLEANERTYFGPVTIDRMRVRLLDDKGNLVNLNDVDWSFSLLIEQLYQY